MCSFKPLKIIDGIFTIFNALLLKMAVEPLYNFMLIKNARSYEYA